VAGLKYNHDRLDMLRVERRLAEELFKASETLRIADVRLREAANPHQTGLKFPDSISESQRARAVWRVAKDAHERAFARWVAFVKHGTVPDDLTP